MENQIKDKIVEIKDCLKRLNPNNNNIGLMGGLSGEIIFQAQVSKQLNLGEDSLNSSLERLFSLIPDSKIGPTYSYGSAGVFYVLNYLCSKEIIDNEFQEFEDELNILLSNTISEYSQIGNFDFLHGSTGILHYLINTTINDNRLFQSFFDIYVNKITTKDNIMIGWSDFDFEKFQPIDTINLGLSHGNAAIINTLSKLFLKINDSKIKGVITNIFKTYKLAKEKMLNNLSVYPYVLDKYEPSRLSWCYGDLGIASSFWQIGKDFNNEEWKLEAINTFLSNTKRLDLVENSVVDAGICHGTAGIAHIYNRMYKETNKREFDEARWYWLDQTLKMAKHEDGLAGYKSWHGKTGWQNDSSLLEGISGIGLVLLGFLSEDINDLDWDKCILLS